VFIAFVQYHHQCRSLESYDDEHASIGPYRLYGLPGLATDCRRAEISLYMSRIDLKFSYMEPCDRADLDYGVLCYDLI
jgi:hypothetical protein